jgi:hypothetical protein
MFTKSPFFDEIGFFSRTLPDKARSWNGSGGAGGPFPPPVSADEGEGSLVAAPAAGGMMQLSPGAPGWQTEYQSINQFDLASRKDTVVSKEKRADDEILAFHPVFFLLALSQKDLASPLKSLR